MKQCKILTFIIFLFVLSISGGTQSNFSQSITKTNRARYNILKGISITPLKFKLQPIYSRYLQNGTLLLGVKDSSLPMITLELQFKGGLNTEPLKDAGILSATVQLLKLGGGGKYNGEEMTRAFSRLGAKLNFSVNYEHWTITLTSLKNDFPKAVALLSDILLKPRLPENMLDTIKVSMNSAILKRNDRPETIAHRKMKELLYPEMRRGYTLTKKDIKNISIKKIKDNLTARLRARDVTIALAGDFGGISAFKKLSQLVSSFPETKKSPDIENLKPENLNRRLFLTKKIILVRFPVKQSVMIISAYLPAHNHSDFFPLQVGNYILGGGSFNSRLMQEIREKRGLAYYAYSYNQFFKNDGRFIAMSASSQKNTKKTLKLMLQIVTNLRKGVTKRELFLAREAIINSLIFQFEDPLMYIRNEIRFRRHGMPDNYLKNFPEHILAVPNRKIQESAHYLNNRSLFIIVVGPETLKTSLEKIRPVIIIDPEEKISRTSVSK